MSVRYQLVSLSSATTVTRVDESAAETLARVGPLFRERIEQQDETHPGYAEAWARFSAVVLDKGGLIVVPPASPDPLIDYLATTGSLASPASTTNFAAEVSDCHANAARLWRASEIESIGTGYALSDDGLWREHSWGWRQGDVLVETTERRRAYFGVKLDGDGAEWFADWQDPTL